jgi:hypothetical protein
MMAIARQEQVYTIPCICNVWGVADKSRLSAHQPSTKPSKSEGPVPATSVVSKWPDGSPALSLAYGLCRLGLGSHGSIFGEGIRFFGEFRWLRGTGDD